MKKNGQVFVKPAEGRKPRNINSGRRIPVEGDWVNDNPQHRRLLNCGDLVESEPETKTVSDNANSKKNKTAKSALSTAH